MNKKKECYIVLFQNGSIQTFNHRVNQDCFPVGSRLFVTNPKFLVCKLRDWIRNNYCHKEIDEIVNWNWDFCYIWDFKKKGELK